jgi:hypothetical protein
LNLAALSGVVLAIAMVDAIFRQRTLPPRR